MDRRAVGTHFAPRPYIRRLADASAWGANNVVVAVPAPLAEHSFEQCRAESKDPQELIAHLAFLTARVSRTHHAVLGSNLNLSPSTDDAPSLGVKALSVGRDVDPLSFIDALARQAGVPRFRIRSNQAWVGGKSPLESALALPDRSQIPAQLADFMSVLRAQQSSASEEAVEALAYQLLTIHPLSDGNGRLTRTLLIQLAVKTSLAYPLYFAWRLMFDRIRTTELWRELAITGRPTPDRTHYEGWLSVAKRLHEACRDAMEHGLDRRVLNALLLYGVESESAILQSTPGLTQGLARKIAINASNGVAGELIAVAKGEVKRAIEDLKIAVME